MNSKKLDIVVIGYIGKDYQGDYIAAELKRAGIDTRALFIDPSGTNRSVNIMQPDGQRKIFYDGKAI